MTRISAIVAFLIVCSSSVRSEVCLWDVTMGGSATITGTNVEIFAAGTYKFEAVTTCGSSTTLGNIGQIKINSGVTGTVNVIIESRANNNTPGAVNVGEILLDNSTGTASYIGNLTELRITGELGVDQPTTVRNMSGVIQFSTTSRDIIVNQSLSADITAPTVGNVDVDVFFLQGASITAGTLGNVTVDNDFNGEITVQGNYAGNITAGDIIGDPAMIKVQGDYTGYLDVFNSFAGHLQIEGSLATPGRIVIGSNPNAPGSLIGDGDINVDLDVSTTTNPPIWVKGQSRPARTRRPGRSSRSAENWPERLPSMARWPTPTKAMMRTRSWSIRSAA